MDSTGFTLLKIKRLTSNVFFWHTYGICCFTQGVGPLHGLVPEAQDLRLEDSKSSLDTPNSLCISKESSVHSRGDV